MPTIVDNFVIRDSSNVERTVVDTDGYHYQRNTKITVSASQLNDVTKRTIIVPLGAVSSTTSFSAYIAPQAGVVTKAKIVTKDAITVSDTDYWTLTLTNKGAAGSGTDKIAESNTKQTGGTAFGAYTARDVGTIDAAKGALVANGVVQLTLTKSGSATAFAEASLMLEVTYS